jgi:GTPase SAR1 family protein
MGKVAIVLRGPPAVGKTSLKNCLLRQLALGEDSFLNLDEYGSKGIPAIHQHETQ